MQWEQWSPWFPMANSSTLFLPLLIGGIQFVNEELAVVY